MKCALEIVAMKELAEKNYRIEQGRLDEECRVQHLQIIQDTIDFCETFIQTKLEECALARESLCIRFFVDESSDRLNHSLFYCLSYAGDYANGTPHYKRNINKIYDLDILQSYLQSHCFKVEIKDTFYKVYGLGSKSGLAITISVE